MTRVAIAICAAVAVAALTCVLLAWDTSRFKTMEQGWWHCRTDATNASISSPIPGVCIDTNTSAADPDCTEEACCLESSGRDWRGPLEPGDKLTVGQLWGRWNYDSSLTQDVDVITVECRVASIDFSVSQAKVNCNVFFFGRFDNGGMFAPRPWRNKPAAKNISLKLNLGSTTLELKEYTLGWTKVEVDLALNDPSSEASAQYYPKTRLPFNLWFSAGWWENSTTDTSGQPVAGNPEPPVLLRLSFNDIPHFMIDETGCGPSPYNGDSEAPGGTYYSLQGNVQLSPAAVESIRSLNAAMWCLAGMTCALTLLWCMLGDPQQHLHFDLMCFSAALLFALPQMRGLLPAIPAAGTQYDVMNVFGQLWLIVASIFLQALKMLSRVIQGEYVRHQRCVAQHSSTRTLPPLPRKQVEAVDASEESLLSSWVQKVTCGG